MINNFKQLEGLLVFDDPGDFYFVQLIQRKKDNPQIERNMNIINNYFFYDIAKYRSLEDRIVHECQAHNARAYLRINKRNAKKVGMQMLKKVTDLIISEDYKALKSAYMSAAGDVHSQEYPRWIVDIDTKDFETYMKVCDYVDYLLLQNRSGKAYCRLMTVDTKNGRHIITHPFRLDLFKEQFPDVDVHKDNPTILYVP
jgi:hypothetical protein